MIEILKKLVKTNHPRSIGVIIKGNKPLKAFIDDFKIKNNIDDTGEAIFCLCQQKYPELCTCGVRKRFFNFIQGYWATCGSKNCSNFVRSASLKEYFLKNPEVMKNGNKKTQDTLQNRYGVNNVSKLEHIKEQKKATCLLNFGVEYPGNSLEIKEKTIQTCLKKYGAANPQQNKDVQEKTRKTCLTKYGVNYTVQSDIFKEKQRKTNFEKYNVEFTSQKHIPINSLTILKDKNLLSQCLSNNTVKIIAEKLEVNPSTIYDYINLHKIVYINPNFSSYEQEIGVWLKSHSINFESNTKKIITPFELDFYIPSQNLAIEFNGLYWHSEMGGKDRTYHLNKTTKCQEKGIRLIHIFEDEWLTKKELCLDLLGRFLNLQNLSVMARKCQIKNVSSKEAKLFLNENHLQGFASASIYLGLYHNNNLIQLMSFRHSRYNKQIEWENIRCCNKVGYKVIGGIQKLWCHFINKYSPKSVVSYCDRRWFLGETYKKLGFSFIKDNAPQYNYTDHQVRWHRSLFTKKKCIQKAIFLNSISKDVLYKMTEKQIAKDVLHMDRIWDAGQSTWIWKA